MIRPRELVLWTAFVAAVVTIFVGSLRTVRFAYSAPSLHVALETGAAVVVLLAAYLVYGRFRESRRLDDLVLVSGLAVLACSNLLFSAIPAAASELSLERLTTWAPVTGRLAGAVLIASAAVLPPRRLSTRNAAPVLVGAAIAVLLVAIALAIPLAEGMLPAGINPSLSPESAAGPRIEGNSAIAAIQLCAVVLYAVAAIGFYRRGEARSDDFMYLLAPTR